jgi:hypothetical protein
VWLYLRFTLSYRDVEELLADNIGRPSIAPEKGMLNEKISFGFDGDDETSRASAPEGAGRSSRHKARSSSIGSPARTAGWCAWPKMHKCTRVLLPR